ncbi:MAG: DUF4340 domain-containing protein [Oliverpabstia sp.]
MSRSKKLSVLLGILLAACVITFGVSKYEERKEQIKNSNEIVMELDSEKVTALAWEYEDETLAFHKDETWFYDEGEAFPVSEEKINELLELFQSFGVSFIIEDVEDYDQYGLDDPICTINISTEEEDYEIQLGDYSTMDEERYVSIGDGNVYLVQNDPLDTYDLELKDMIQNDEVPDIDQVTEIQFAGSENYTAVYQEENKITYSDEDVYFVEKDGETLPLDTDNVDSYVYTISTLSLNDYVSYNATEEELESCGLDNPELSVTMQYTTQDEESEEEQTGTFVLHISRDSEEKAEAESSKDKEKSSETDSDETEEEITAYARVGESQIIYKISGTEYETLIAASYNDLRHQDVIWAEFADVTQVDINLEDVDYMFTSEEDDDETIWYYQEEEVEIDDFRTSLASLTASEFTDKQPEGKKEISLVVHLDNENIQQVKIELYRYDGSSCLAVVDGEPVSLIDRSYVVNLIEAVNTIVLN